MEGQPLDSTRHIPAAVTANGGGYYVQPSYDSLATEVVDAVDQHNPAFQDTTEQANPAFRAAQAPHVSFMEPTPQAGSTGRRLYMGSSESYTMSRAQASSMAGFKSGNRPAEISADSYGHTEVQPEPRTPGQGPAGYNAEMYSAYEDDYDDEEHGTEDYEDEEDDEEMPLKPTTKRKPPIVHRWNIIPCIMLIWFLGASGYYYYVRWKMLTYAYAIFVFSVEVLGWTSFTPYAVLICRGVYPTGSPGLPAVGSPEADEQAAWWASPSKRTPRRIADSKNATPMSHYRGGTPGYGGGTMSPAISIPETSYFMYRFHVRVLVPCYKEDLAVIASTVQAALSADLPALTRRTVYLCDDGKDPEKQSFIEGLRLSGEDVVYVSGRIRKKGEVNGKSANLNNCLKNVIYKNYPKNDDGDIDWTEISNKECLVVFDADMNCKPDFFLKELEVLVDDEIALLLSPQAFYNIDTDMDIFNAINAQFWEYWLPGAFGWGYIACTGTNFMIRARALAHAGFFPEYTITEDYALGMELKARGYKATYLCQYIAVGEAPEEARNIFQQRSRWTKGHYQVFFSGVNAMLNMQLPFFQRLWYTYAAWAPFCTAVTVPAFMAVPFMSLVFGLNPVSITFEFVLASTLYFVAIQAVQNYCTQWSHLKLMWYVNVSNTVLWFTYVKAFFNTLALKAGMKIATFKATAKTKTIDPNAPPPPQAPAPLPTVPEAEEVVPLVPAAATAAAAANTTMVGRIMSNISQRFTPRKNPETTSLLANDHGPKADDDYAYPVRVGRETPVKSTPQYKDPTRARLLGNGYGSPSGRNKMSDMVTPSKQVMATPAKGAGSSSKQQYTALPTSYQEAPLPPPPPVHENTVSGWARVKAMAATFKPQNASEFGKMFDPLALLFLWCFNVGTVGVGIWQLSMVATNNTTTTFMFNSPLTGNPYLIISTAWALYNSLSPYLFLHYCFTAGTSFKFMVKWIMFFSSVIMVGSMVIVWLLIPTEFNTQEVVTLAVENYFPSTVAHDTNTNYQFVIGRDAFPVPPSMLEGLMTTRTLDSPWNASLVDLTGGLLVSDHVKYAVPIAYSVSMMAWSYLTFPKGLGQSGDKLLDVMREGADYLMRSYIQLPDGSSVYVAQIGDGADYAYYPDPGYDPIGAGKIWTSPEQDAQLNGNATRKVWLMTAATIGADLLADVSAALASTSMVFKDIDPAFSHQALGLAEKIYQFATLQADEPKSYCNYVPCTTNVTYTKQVMAHPYIPPPPDKPVCYYLDWVDKACYISMNLSTCIAIAENQREVFKSRDACCNAMANTHLWDGLTSKAQGICAVPVDQFYCFIPDDSLRTCYQYAMDNTTGKGCVGQGLEIFGSSHECCQYLQGKGIIDAANNKPGSGSCARTYQDPNFTTCYVPVLNNATCIAAEGADCAAFGVANNFDDVSGCCNYIISTMQTLGFNKAGGIQLTPSGMCTLHFTFFSGPQLRRSMLDSAKEAGSTATTPVLEPLKRKLGQTTPAAAAPSTTITIATGTGGNTPSTTTPVAAVPIDNSSYWLPPQTQSASQCADNVCQMILVEASAEVAFFNSTSVLDDLAWAAIWLYKATGNTLYMGQAQKFTERHYKEDITIATMISDISYYRPDWNNLAWNVNVLMAGITQQQTYIDMSELLLKTWVFGNSVNLDTPLPPATAVVNIKDVTALTNFTDTNTGVVWEVVPECNPTAIYEDNCYDGVDNNCNGLTDREDPDCGIFPVQYTPHQLAFSGNPGAPNTGNAAMTALMYAETASPDTARRLRCWALNQVAYMIGVMPDQPSLVVGYGAGSPVTVQHRASSCPVVYSVGAVTMQANTPKANFSMVPPDELAKLSTARQSLLQQSAVKTDQPPCNWDNAFYPSTANPQLDMIQGALLTGPLSYYPFLQSDTFSKVRTSASTAISLHNTIGFTIAAMGLAHTETTIRSCELLHGVYQKYSQNGVL